MPAKKKLIGVLAIQGDFNEHVAMVQRCGAEAVLVKLPEDLAIVSGLIIPGGESPVIGRSLKSTGLGSAIITRAKKGMPIFGTCAGAILLAKTIVNYPHQYSLKLIDMSIDRNTYGRQIDSFTTTVKYCGSAVEATFIRGPTIVRVGKHATAVSSLDGIPVIVQQGNLIACTFHPELTDDTTVHRSFIRLCAQTNV